MRRTIDNKLKLNEMQNNCFGQILVVSFIVLLVQIKWQCIKLVFRSNKGFLKIRIFLRTTSR